MNKVVKYYFAALLALAMGCVRQELVAPFGDYVTLPLSVDWSRSQLPESYVQSLSLYLYPHSGGAPIVEISGAVDSLSVRVPEGEYSLLLFNDFVEDLGGVVFSSEASYREFTASAVASGMDSVAVGDRLAAWRLDTLQISKLGCGYCDSQGVEVTISDSLIGVQPTPVTALNTITLRVENLNNARSISGIMRGAATAANLSTNLREESATEKIYHYTFTNRSYDSSSTTDGTAEATFLSFGRQPTSGAEYELELMVELLNGEQQSYTRIVTEQVAASSPFDIIINLTDSAAMLSLPKAEGAGFSVEGWGESENLNLN